MSWIEDLGNGLKDAGESLGEALIAAPGAVYDLTTYAVPGVGRGYGEFGSMLDSIGGRFLDLADPLGIGYDEGISKAFGKTMEGLTWAYHEGIDQPLSTAVTMASHLDSGGDSQTHYGDLFSGDAWSKAYEIAETQSLGQSIVYAADNQNDPFEDTGQTQEIQLPDGTIGTRELSPFEATAGKNNPFLSNALAFSVDLAASWYLDPASVAAMGVGKAYQARGLGKISEVDRVDFADQLDGASLAVDAVGLSKRFAPKNASVRVESFIDFAHTNSLNGAEVRAVFPEMKASSAGRQLATLLADATKIEDPTERGNAVRRVLAVGAGDVSQIERLKAQVPAAKAMADTLGNIASQKTVKLAEQALATARTENPAFRLEFNKQLENLDHADDLSAFIKGWHSQLADKVANDSRLLDAAGGLDYVPAPGALSKRRLTAIRGKTGANLGTIERAHDQAFDRLNRFGQADGYSTVYQRGLSSVPLIVAYPAKLAGRMLPTKAIPAAVRNLRQVHLNGFVNTHDWDGAVDQLDSMMRVGGVQNDERLSILSEAMRLGTGEEAAKAGMIERVENASVDALATRLTEKFGVNVDADFIKQSMLEGHRTRQSQMGAFGGGRQYASSSMEAGRLVDEETALRFKGDVARRRANQVDQRVADERADAFGAPRVDLFDDASGVPVAMPLVTSQLANRIPLFDIERANKLATDKAYVMRLAQHSEMYADQATELTGLKAALTRAKGSEAARIQARIENVRKTQDMLLSVAGAFNHTWKMSVLFRLGYPMRVLADDHLRIASRFGYMPFLGANVPEAVSNSLWNHLPGGSMRGGQTRKASARLAYEHAKQRRSELRMLLGRDAAHNDAEWAELADLSRVVRDGVTAPEIKASAASRVRELDPDGYVQEYLDLQAQAAQLNRAIGGHRGSITRWKNLDEAGNADKISAAQELIAERQGALDQVLMQLDGVQDPDALRRELTLLQEALRKGPKGFLAEKRTIGTRAVDLGDGLKAKGAFDPTAHSYYEATSSQANFNAVISDGEESLYNSIASGHWRTVTPEEPGYYQLWANILNHQMQHSPEYMAIIKGKVRSPDEFSKWLAKPENRHVRERVPHFAADPEDWGGRLLAVVQDYIPTQELQDLVAAGRVSQRDLKRLFPRDAQRPTLHGQLADTQSGRNSGVRAMGEGINNVFRYLSEVPTDHLSRHPYFNAVYKREVKAAAANRMTSKGGSFSQVDVDEIERLARKRALHELKTTLWDVSSHSHGAHVMRFISPFFAAHQEALSRWWGLSKENPAIIRKFQLAFDAPRKAGLVVDSEGNPVEPGEGVSSEHRIMMRMPFADDNTWVNKTLLEIGGGKYWTANENGFNVILQSGVANPGVGPFVTIPLEGFVQKYAESDRLEKAARVLNAFPPTASGFKEIAASQLTPAWAKRFIATASPDENREFLDSFMQNYSDALIEFRLAHPGKSPSRQEEKEIRERAQDLAHRDLKLMMISNLGMFTPVKPGSKYAVVQDGLNRLREQQQREGHDYDWLRTTFASRYGDAYLAMLNSMSTNAANLDGTKSEVKAIKAHRSLLDRVDVGLTRMVIGPDSERWSAQDSAMGAYSPAARAYLRGEQVDPYSSETYIGSKSVDEAALDLAAQQGWQQYDELTEWLQYQADQKGLASYEQDPTLSAMRKQGLAYIKANNEVWADEWNSYTPENYEAKLDDMRVIAKDPKLNSDPFRSQDMLSLQRYIELRDYIKYQMDLRGAKSLSDSPNSPNADLAMMMRQGMDNILANSGIRFRQFSYSGVIERDPLLALSSEYDLAPAG